MEFRILDPLEVRVGEWVLSLSGAEQRTVRALLLRAVEVVSSDRLIDDLSAERSSSFGGEIVAVGHRRASGVCLAAADPLARGTVVNEGRRRP
jgi:hypothetical protein